MSTRDGAADAASSPVTRGAVPWAGRVEDEAFLRGEGRYTADLEGAALVARFVRSDLAHARIRSLDLSVAREMPEVVGVFAMPDLAGLLPLMPAAIDAVTNRDGSVTPVPGRPALAHDRVRFVGEAYAVVIARTESAAEDAAELLEVDFEELAPSSDLRGERSAPALHAECPDDVAFDWLGGDEAGVGEALAAARHVVTREYRLPRILGAPLEPFACRADYDAAAGTWTLTTPSQGVHAIRRELADGYLGVPHGRLRVVTPDVGGAFGIRIHALPEQAVLLAASRLVGAPVIWRPARTETNLCEPHARDMTVRAELALDGDGRLLGLRATATCGMGAYVHPGARATPTGSLLFGLMGAYRIPAASLHMQGRYTNTTPTGPFRGAGQPEGAYVVERLMDAAAEVTGLGPIELRRRNALAAGDERRNGTTAHRVSGCHAAPLLRQAELWISRRPEPAPHAMAGTGLALYLKVNGMGRREKAEISVDPASGTVTATIGSQTNGQGHTTTFAALTAERLGLARGDVRIVQGDTAQVAFGTGTGASSALATTGTGLARSSSDLLAKARALAAGILEAPADALAYDRGSFRLPGGNRFVTLQEIAAASPDGLVGRSEVDVCLTYTVGCHACQVEIDRETGAVRLLAYAAFDDLGPVLQPAIARGQIHGGAAQGIGQALHEAVRYDSDSAQPTSVTFLDYQLPRAGDLPDFEVDMAETPAEGSDLQVRGAGEAGAVASMAAVVNAVASALGSDEGLEAPLTSGQIWRHLRRRGAPA